MGGLAALRVAVSPMELPAELEVLLRSHNGQAAGGEWWPTLECGPLLGADRIVEQWYQAAGDAVPERSGTIIDASWPYRPRAVAPSLADALDAAVDLARAGLLPTLSDDRARQEERAAFLDDLWQSGWAGNVLGRRSEIDPVTWPDSRGGPHLVNEG